MVYDAAGNQIFVATVPGAHPLLLHAGSVVNWHVDSIHGCKKPIEMFCVLFTEMKAPYAVFWNPDGSPEDICGNGLRAVAKVMNRVGKHSLIRTRRFDATVFATGNVASCALPWPDVAICANHSDRFHVDVGTPHLVQIVDTLDIPNLHLIARDTTNGKSPLNVTYLCIRNDTIQVRTVERGVGETRSCGTGAIAAYAVSCQCSRTIRARNRVTIHYLSGEMLYLQRERRTNSVTITGKCVLVFKDLMARYIVSKSQ